MWLERWKGNAPRPPASAADYPNVESLKQRWLEGEGRQRPFLNALTADRLAATVPYVNQQGESWAYPLWRQMYHVVNHSNYHRGQVTTLLRQLAVPPVSLDFLIFHDELNESDVA